MAPRKAKYVVGIDLGTTNCAVACSPIDQPALQDVPVAQLVAPGEVGERPLFPSALYLPADAELPPNATALPWEAPAEVLGEGARLLGARTPGRLVTSAKSWLCQERVDRDAAILPWGAGEGVKKLSPVAVSARILAQLRGAWDHAHSDAKLEEQECVLTVPASFDEGARELTLRAAKEAGLGKVRLLEEPQAALYDFLHEQKDALATALAGVRLVLVIDVGGGTTDLTLVRVQHGEQPPPRLERVAVGEHLMLGGDNMDVTLARHVEAKLSTRLEGGRWAQLVQSCRSAKEKLLSDDPPAELTISVAGAGSRLVGGAQSVKLGREEAEAILLDGFLPRCGLAEVPQRDRRTALTELGLPYAADPAISRHVVAFLRRHVEAAAEAGVEIRGGLPRPDAILLNGGVFHGRALVTRLAEVTAGWFGEPIPTLPHGSLDRAVARGAAWHGLVRRGHGVKIAGGSPRSYYVGIDEAGGRRALCVVPRGMEEGTEQEAAGRTFRLVLNRPVSFPLYASAAARHDRAGDLVALDDELLPLPPLATVLRTPGETGEVPVRLRAALTEIGTLELFASTTEGFRRRWRLEFSVRGGEEGAGGGGAQVAPIDELPQRFPEAKEQVALCYGKQAQAVEAREVKQLQRALEKILGDRDGWSSAVNRELWGVVFGGAQKRRRTADHERIFFQLVGFLLRPGWGAPLDDWRVGELWRLWQQGVQYTTEKANWSEWWLLWRRVAGGLDGGRQRQLFEAVKPWLKPPEGRSPPKPKGPKAEGHDEMVRLLASLERLPPEDKLEAARWIRARFDQAAGTRSAWPFGRLFARQLLHAGPEHVVPPEALQPWLQLLLGLPDKGTDGLAFALAQLGRRTGDRARDLPEQQASLVAARIEALGGAPEWARAVREVVAISAQDELRIFGDTLPSGLKLQS